MLLLKGPVLLSCWCFVCNFFSPNLCCSPSPALCYFSLIGLLKSVNVVSGNSLFSYWLLKVKTDIFLIYNFSCGIFWIIFGNLLLSIFSVLSFLFPNVRLLWLDFWCFCSYCPCLSLLGIFLPPGRLRLSKYAAFLLTCGYRFKCLISKISLLFFEYFES